MILRPTTSANGIARLLPERPLPEAARRLREVFPELWARYELLVATRDVHPERKPRGSPRRGS